MGYQPPYFNLATGSEIYVSFISPDHFLRHNHNLRHPIIRDDPCVLDCMEFDSHEKHVSHWRRAYVRKFTFRFSYRQYNNFFFYGSTTIF